MNCRLTFRRVVCLPALAALLASCGTAPVQKGQPASPATPAPTPGVSSKYYKDDGPGANPPANLEGVPDAVPKLEPLNRFANRPYTVLGRDYVPATSLRPYQERGIASWYGRKFHGEKTSTGETYDMYAMTAAHPTLPLPSYARVTNAASGKSVIVRVNDRGPFLHGRVIDLSYAAANRIGIAEKGSGEVVVESIVPGGTRVAEAALPSPAASATGTAMATAPATSAAAVAPMAEPGALVARADVPEARGAAGFVVQLGAFANFANAQAFLTHVQNQTAAAQVEAKVRQSNGLYRVYVGPYADREDARRAAERITRAFGFAATVAPH